MAKRGQPKGTTKGKGVAAAGEANGETPSGYFRRVFKENPHLLGSKSNAELFGRWLADHPSQTEVPKNVKGIVFNLKSVLRKEGRKKLGRPKKMEQPTPVEIADTPPKPTRIALRRLEAMEEQIDAALTFARSLDQEGLEDVIRLLRKARNTVVFQIGE